LLHIDKASKNPTAKIRSIGNTLNCWKIVTETRSLREKLALAVTDLVWLSESDYPFEIIDWQIESIEPVILLKQIDRPEDTLVEVVELEAFFATATQEQDWYDESELETVKRYRDLVEILKTNLQEVAVYRVGEIEIEVYILGKTSSNAIAGLKTQVVET
jgi:hypothetical protein